MSNDLVKVCMFHTEGWSDIEIEVTPEQYDFLMLLSDKLNDAGTEYAPTFSVVNISENQRIAKAEKEKEDARRKAEKEKEDARRKAEHEAYVRENGAIAMAFKLAMAAKKKEQ